MTVAAKTSFTQARLEELDHLEARAQALVALSDTQLHWQPPEGGWSIAQVLEHLVLTNSDYLGLMRAAVDKAPKGASATGEWRPSLMGNLLFRAMQSPNRRKVKAPRRWQPGAPRPDVLGAFLQSLREVRALLEASHGLDFSRVGIHSPVSKLIRLNLGDGFMTVTAHSELHLEQVGRIRAQEDFPA